MRKDSKGTKGGIFVTLNIDGFSVEAGPGESLLDLISRLPIPAEKLSERPLAAKIAGEVFTLNYIPLRQKDAQGERPSMRQAMAASEGKVHLLRYTDEAGKECYLRTALFATFLALKQCCPRARGKVSCTLGSSVYVQVSGAKNFSAEELKKIPQESENYRKYRLEKFRRVAREKHDRTPYEKETSADIPCHLNGGR